MAHTIYIHYQTRTMQLQNLKNGLPLLAVLGSVTALGVGTSYAKHLFPLVGAMGTTALRVGFSALLLLMLWRPWRWQLRRGDAGSIARYGIALGLMNLLFYLSLNTLPFGLAVAIEFAGPLSVSLFSSRKRIDFVWLGLAVLGLGLLLPLGHSAQPLDPLGVLYALLAAACWAAYIVFGKRLGHLHAGQSVAWGLSVAAITVAPFGLAQAGMALLDPSILLYAVGVAVVSSAIPISLEMMALKRLPKEAFGIMTSMEPAVAAVLGMLVLHEHLNFLQWCAIGCSMLAAAGSSLTAGRTEPAAAASDVLVS
jgi:inner membrane transporter RhtA